MLIIVTDTKKLFGSSVSVYELRNATETEAFEAFEAVSEIYASERDRYNITLQHFPIEDLEPWVYANLRPHTWWERLIGRVGVTIHTFDRAS